jgi:hypothetical protein
MAHYLVHIQLHNANQKDEAAVENSMTGAGFSKTIVEHGETYVLPSGDFHIFSSASFDEIYQIAGQAAYQPQKPFGIVMVDIARIGFFGLQKSHA